MKPSSIPATSRSGWISGFYVVDDYQLAVPLDAPPVVANLRAGLLDQGQLVPLVGGGQVASLAPIRIRGHGGDEFAGGE